MLPKENQLKKRKDFELVFKKGKGFKGDFLFLKVFKNNLEASRFGFIVSSKISKKAVIRNKIKRRLRAIVRQELPVLKKGVDVVVVANSGVENKDFQAIKKELSKVFISARIL